MFTATVVTVLTTLYGFNYKSLHCPVYSSVEITESRLAISCPYTVLFRSVWGQGSSVLSSSGAVAPESLIPFCVVSSHERKGQDD